MKKVLLLASICLLTLVACSAAKDNTRIPDDPSQDQPASADPSQEVSDDPSQEGFTLPDNWNGHFVAAIAGAYDEFEKTDVLPRTINVDGMGFGTAQYTMAACYLILKIDAAAKDGGDWSAEDIEPAKYGGGSATNFNSWDRNVITREELVYLADKTAAYTEKSLALPNYVTFEGKVDIVGTEHDRRISSYNYSVILARAINAFAKTGKLPEEISSWPSDYLHAANNCPIDDPLVLSTLEEAIKGCTTDREKAEAIFAYTRDEYEWENYMNTSKGAVGTIKAKGGNCCDLTHATVALCRAAGIPARYLHGQCYFASGVIGHVIPEIYADGQWWICDPSNNSCTWGVPNWKGMETLNSRYVELPF